MWIKCKYEKCSRKGIDNTPFINYPINLNFVVTIQHYGVVELDRFVLEFTISYGHSVKWYYLFSADCEDDYNKILELLEIK